MTSRSAPSTQSSVTTSSPSSPGPWEPRAGVEPEGAPQDAAGDDQAGGFRAGGEPPAGRERVFNAPVLALLVALSIPALYYLQSRQPDQMGLLYTYALIPSRLADGALLGLFTHMLLHGGWAHAGMNAVGALAFGTPVARALPGSFGAFGFLSLYIVCGVIAGGGYALLHINSVAPLVGASGAVFGLIGAATRMMGGHGRLLKLTDRRVLSAAGAWIGVNVLIGVLGVVPGAGDARIAWEAHVIGLVAGLILIGPWLRLFGPRRRSLHV